MDSDWMAGSPDVRTDLMRCRRRCRGWSARSNRKTAGVPNPKFARLLSGHFCELRVQRDTRTISLLVSLWFGSSLRNKLRMRANFRTATLAPSGAHTGGFSDRRPPHLSHQDHPNAEAFG